MATSKPGIPTPETALDASLWRSLDGFVRATWHDDLRVAREDDIRRDRDVIVEGVPTPLQSSDPEISGDALRETLLFLPFPYLTAGGRDGAFGEMYGWDTFFINLGLLAHERQDLVRGHLMNQLYMIDRYGMVLNGNRTYYLTRSQTPLLAESIRRYHASSGDDDFLLRSYLTLCHEYRDYWCAPHHSTPTGLATNRDLGDPRLRPELAAEAELTDFTPCFAGDITKCNPLITNCALVRYARVLEWMASRIGRHEEARQWREEAALRADRINRLCWSDGSGFFLEYQYEEERQLPFLSLAGYWPMWAGIASADQAAQCVNHLALFESEYGLSYTAEEYASPHPEYEWIQFCRPAGWPPMHVIVVEALDACGYAADALRVARSFLSTIINTHQRTGKLWEKYNMETGRPEFDRGRYATPPMHGWTAAAVAILGRRIFAGGA